MCSFFLIDLNISVRTILSGLLMTLMMQVGAEANSNLEINNSAFFDTKIQKPDLINYDFKNLNFRHDLSDEFNDLSIDTARWFIAGDKENVVVYENSLDDGSAADWDGRAPGAFDKNSPFIEQGILHLPVKWDPAANVFPVLDENGNELIDDDCGCKYEKYTTSGLISRSNIQYGYFEIRANAAPVSVSSAFWLVGNHFEIDIFELIGKAGNGEDRSGDEVPFMMPVTIHNWDVGDLQDNGFGKDFLVDWNVSKDFHIYGAKVSHDNITFFADRKTLGSISRKEAKKIWNTDYMHLWLDNEIFIWEGVPPKEDLPAYFLIDYVRVWEDK